MDDGLIEYIEGEIDNHKVEIHPSDISNKIEVMLNRKVKIRLTNKGYIKEPDDYECEEITGLDGLFNGVFKKGYASPEIKQQLSKGRIKSQSLLPQPREIG